MKHRLFALLLAAAMLFTLAACGSADSDAPDESSPAQSETPSPSGSPSESPSEEPSESPSEEPSESPSESPSEKPSESPSESPSEEPSESPSESPSEKPSESPSESPSEEPSESPSAESSETPSASPTPSAPSGGGNLVEEGILPTPKPTPAPTPTPTPAPSPTPTPTPTPTPSPDPTPAPPAQTGGVDLQEFYESLLVKYEEAEFKPQMALEGDGLDNWYPGLKDLSPKQTVIYTPMISAVACEIALVEVENAADVQTVKDIFQTRIDYQVGTDDEPGGAWYPETIEGWKNNSRIVDHGNYVMLIVWEDCDALVADFNALF